MLHLLLAVYRDVFAEILNGFKLLTIFARKHSICLSELKIIFGVRVWNIELTLVPGLVKSKNYSTRKYVRHRFWNGALKTLLLENLQNSQENICAGISFFKYFFSCMKMYIQTKKHIRAIITIRHRYLYTRPLGLPLRLVITNIVKNISRILKFVYSFKTI